MTAAAFKATYSDWRLIKGRKVVQVVFEMPLEYSDQAYAALGGMPNPAAEIWCGIARLNLSKIGSNEAVGGEAKENLTSGLASPSNSRRKPVAPEHKLSMKAALICQEPPFLKYLAEHRGVVCYGITGAAEWLRQRCGVVSRAEIKPGTAAGFTFEEIYNDYMLWLNHPELADA